MAKILPIPEIREELRIAAKAGTLVPFIGAGTSMLAGGPSWNGLADAAINFFVKQGKLNFGQFEQIRKLSPRIKLSIAKSLEEGSPQKIDYNSIFHPPKNKNPNHEKGERLYAHLSTLSNKFVTTNYDHWLAQEYFIPDLKLAGGSTEGSQYTPKQRRVLHKVKDFTYDNLADDTVIKLHGSVDDPESMVLTTKDYIKRYLNDRDTTENLTLTFLRTLFRLRNVLFIGYGLEEIEILEYVIQKSAQTRSDDPKETRHFILQGYFSHEQEIANRMEEYFLRECGVQLLPYLKDERDWDQLLNVLEVFAQEIPVGKTLKVQQYQDMEALLQ